MTEEKATKGKIISEDPDRWDGRWVILGVGGETLVGCVTTWARDGVSALEDERMHADYLREYAANEYDLMKSLCIWLYPCYKQELHVIPVPQANAAGRQVGVGLVRQESSGSPSGVPCDVEVCVRRPDWVIVPYRMKDLNDRNRVLNHVKRIVKASTEMQLKLRSAAAGLQT